MFFIIFAVTVGMLRKNLDNLFNALRAKLITPSPSSTPFNLLDVVSTDFVTPVIESTNAAPSAGTVKWEETTGIWAKRRPLASGPRRRPLESGPRR